MTFVYVITHTDGHAVPQGPIKIGITDADPYARLSQLQTGNPAKLTVFGCLEVPGRDAAILIEKWCHEAVHSRRLSGEWFDLTPTQGIEIIEHNRTASGLINLASWVL